MLHTFPYSLHQARLKYRSCKGREVSSIEQIEHFYVILYMTYF